MSSSIPAVSLPDHIKTILITGAGGFLGQRLLTAIAAASSTVSIVLTDISPPPIPAALKDSGRITAVGADLADATDLARLFGGIAVESGLAVYALHGLMSGGSEADFELGYRVNVDSHIALLKVVREAHKSAPAGSPLPLYVYTSSLAVYGGPQCRPESMVDPGSTPLQPQSSYGAQKAVVELYVFDATRKGFIDGRILRLPTVAVRPGAPSSAASSFISGLVREPLMGVPAVCPIANGPDEPSLDMPFYFTSTSTVVFNLLYSLTIPGSAFPAHSRTVNLPSCTTTSRKLLAALKAVAGPEPLELISYERDERVVAIVESWPGSFVNDGPVAMGFRRDDATTGFEMAIRDYKAELEQQT